MYKENKECKHYAEQNFYLLILFRNWNLRFGI